MKYYLTLLSLWVTVAAGAQDFAKIRTDDDVVKLVTNSLDLKQDTFQLITGDEWQNIYNIGSDQIAQAQKETAYAKWVKADFNHDGLPDIVVSGYIENSDGTRKYMILGFLSEGKRDFTLQDVVVQYQSEYPWYFQLIHIGNKPALSLTRWIALSETDNQLPRQVDTSVLLNNYFVNYHSDPVGLDSIVSLTYLSNSPYKTRLELKPNPRKKRWDFTYSSLDEEDDSRPLKGGIQNDLNKELWQFFKVLRGAKRLHSSFSNMGNTEGQSIELVFANGRKLKIKGQEVQDDLTMSAIYDWLDHLIDKALNQERQRQNWMSLFNDIGNGF